MNYPPDNRADLRLRDLYGITLAEYYEMFDSQGKVCYICGVHPKTRRLHVDHYHVKGYKQLPSEEKRKYVRGLLCASCNKGLAYFRDNEQNFLQAAEYVRRWPGQQTLNPSKRRPKKWQARKITKTKRTPRRTIKSLL